MDEKKYSIGEVAEMLGMTLKNIRRFVASGELKSTKKITHIPLRKRTSMPLSNI